MKKPLKENTEVNVLLLSMPNLELLRSYGVISTIISLETLSNLRDARSIFRICQINYYYNMAQFENQINYINSFVKLNINNKIDD
jgi:hypothetical protein